MIFNPYFLLGALVSALALAAGGYYYGGKHADAAWKVTIAAQKLDAAMQLADVIRLNGIKEEADRQRAITNQKDYDAKLSEYQKRLADSDAKRRADGLRFSVERRGVCGDSATSQAGTSAGTVENVPLEIRVPDALANALFDLASEADKLAVWAESCYKFVNKLDQIKAPK